MALKLTAAIDEFIARQHVMTLATQGSDGPWAAALFYVRDGDGLVFLSSPSSRHATHFALQPRCAATIQPPAQEWSEIQGVQLEGDVSELDGADRTRAQGLYAGRFPFVRPGFAPAAIVTALARVRWYRLHIERLHFIDNARGFGKRETFAQTSD